MCLLNVCMLDNNLQLNAEDSFMQKYPRIRIDDLNETERNCDDSSNECITWKTKSIGLAMQLNSAENWIFRAYFDKNEACTSLLIILF